MKSEAKVMIFLGAGASASLDIPTSKGFPEYIQGKYNWDAKKLCSKCADYLQSVDKGEYTSEEIDAEDLRDWLMTMENITESLVGIKNSIPPLSKFGGDPGQSNTYVKEVRQKFDDIIRETYKGVSKEQAHNHYHALLQRLFDFGLSVLPIFTTNYDLVLEEYAEHSEGSINFVDGFKRGHSGAGVLRLDTKLFETSKNGSNMVLFFKLHGSTTWFQNKENMDVISLPFGSIPPADYENLLLYPTKGKKEMLGTYPFKEYYTYLKEYLEIESVRLCIVIGYSFGDNEINEYFKTAIQRGMRFMIIDPNPFNNIIGLQSRQYSKCDSQFAPEYWDRQIRPQLENELKILTS